MTRSPQDGGDDSEEPTAASSEPAPKSPPPAATELGSPLPSTTELGSPLPKPTVVGGPLEPAAGTVFAAPRVSGESGGEPRFEAGHTEPGPAAAPSGKMPQGPLGPIGQQGAQPPATEVGAPRSDQTVAGGPLGAAPVTEIGSPPAALDPAFAPGHTVLGGASHEHPSAAAAPSRPRSRSVVWLVALGAVALGALVLAIGIGIGLAWHSSSSWEPPPAQPVSKRPDPERPVGNPSVERGALSRLAPERLERVVENAGYDVISSQTGRHSTGVATASVGFRTLRYGGSVMLYQYNDSQQAEHVVRAFSTSNQYAVRQDGGTVLIVFTWQGDPHTVMRDLLAQI